MYGRARKKTNQNYPEYYRRPADCSIFSAVPEDPRVREPYVLARCCRPRPEDDIVGYNSFETAIKVHRADCANLARTEEARLVRLAWTDILAPDDFSPGDDYLRLDSADFAVLEHHARMGLDYSLVVARSVAISKSEAFERHRKLRDMGLLERVDKVMIRYRKGVVDNKWIKHRNHTYYDLTVRGRLYLAYFRSHGPAGDAISDSTPLK